MGKGLIIFFVSLVVLLILGGTITFFVLTKKSSIKQELIQQYIPNYEIVVFSEDFLGRKVSTDFSFLLINRSISNNGSMYINIADIGLSGVTTDDGRAKSLFIHNSSLEFTQFSGLDGKFYYRQYNKQVSFFDNSSLVIFKIPEEDIIGKTSITHQGKIEDGTGLITLTLAVTDGQFRVPTLCIVDVGFNIRDAWLPYENITLPEKEGKRCWIIQDKIENNIVNILLFYRSILPDQRDYIEVEVLDKGMIFNGSTFINSYFQGIRDIGAPNQIYRIRWGNNSA